MRHDADPRSAGPRRCALSALARRPARADPRRPVLVLPRVAPGTRLLLGRSRSADVRFLDPTISRHHAELQRVANGWLVIDHGSSRGTTLNGRPVTIAILRDGDLLQLGHAPAMVVRI